MLSFDPKSQGLSLPAGNVEAIYTWEKQIPNYCVQNKVIQTEPLSSYWRVANGLITN